MPQSLVDFSQFSTPTTKERKEAAGVTQSEATTEKTEAEINKLNLTLPAVKEKADADAKVAAYNAANLGFEDANKEFQKQYVAWRAGSAEDFFDKINQLQKAVRVLRSGKQITGPLFNQLPPLVKTLTSPQSTDVRSDVEKIVQGALRETLGAQFTQVEGDRLLARIFDPNLPEQFVAENVEAELNKIAALAKSREAMSRYYEENSTLKGYRPDEWLPKVEADFKVMQGVPAKEQAAAEAMSYRDAMNDIGGDPLRGWRLRPGEEQQLVAYANSNDFTPEGFVAMASDMIRMASGEEPNMANLLAETREIAKRPKGARLGGVNYSAVDEAAARNAGLSDVALQALKNLPESGVMMVSSLLSPVSDALRSTVLGERVGVYKTFPDLIADVAAKAGIGETDQATLDALSASMVDRYGSMAGFKQAVATDPLGVIGDASVIFTLGGSAAARAPGVIGRAGTATARVGAALDPLSFAGNMAARGATALPEGVKAAPGTIAREGLSMTTGAPASAFGQAFERGAGRQRVGATPITEAFREGISGDVMPETLVENAKSAMQEMRSAASRDYRSGMVDISKDKTVLSFDELDRTLDKMRADAMYKGEVVKPEVLNTVDDMQTIVNNWRGLDPAEFHTPEGFDKLKQRLFEATENIPFDDRTRRRAAGAVYGAVKDTIRSQAPTYSKVMDQYSDAQQTLGRMESELGLGRGAVDTAATKLTQRPPSRKGRDDLVSLLADYDPKLAAQVAGEQLSPVFPRGLRSVGAGVGTALGAIGNVASLGLISPRLMGEAAYGAGRASVPIGQAIDVIQQNPAAVLAAQRGIAATEATELERENQEMLERYGLALPPTISDAGTIEEQVTPEILRLAAEQPAPGVNLGGFEPQYEAPVAEVAPAEAPGPKGGDMIVVDNRDAVYDPTAEAYIFVDTGEIARKAMQRGGMVQGYNRGGRKKPERSGAEVARDFGRTVLRGVTFANNDEIEAALRAAPAIFSGRYGEAYDDEAASVRQQMDAYKKDHPYWAAGGEIGGMMLTSAVPGLQGLSAARVAQMTPRARAAYEAALATGQGGVYGAGDARNTAEIPSSVAREGALGAVGYPVARGIGRAGTLAVKKIPGVSKLRRGK